MSLPPESHRLQPDHLPTPFSAAQIREGCPPGRTIRLREEVPGQAATYRRIRFTTVDEESSVQELQATDEHGAPIGEPMVGSSTWLDLQRHASQPGEATTRKLQDFVKARLVPYKYPRVVRYLDSLPKTGTGKIDRQALRTTA